MVYIRVYESTLETFAVMVEHIVLEVRNLEVDESAATAKWRKKINWVVQVFNDMRENDERVYKAIIVLFESKDDIEIFNKKAVYLYLREITGLNTKQVVNSLNKFREHYRDFKTDWEDGKI